jgi:hypothetical protein
VRHHLPAVCVLLSACLAAALSGGIQRPIALDSLPSTGLFVLGGEGTVYQLKGSSGRYTMVNRFQLPPNEYPADFTLAQFNREFYLFVTSNDTSRLGDPCRVTQYTLEGSRVRFWTMRGVCAGIDYNGDSHTVYVYRSDADEIYTIRLEEGRNNVSYLGSVGHNELGPLAFDAASKKLYLGDIESGGIYAFNLVTRKSEGLVRHLGPTTLLRVAAGQLLAADSQSRHVVSFDLQQSSKPSPRVIARVNYPTGLAAVEPGILAVSDYGGRILFISLATGQVVGQF